jgi:xanthine dehydrogenase YagR molybdenum-binding subunit
MDRVRVEMGDTWLPEGPYTGGSMVTASLAPAAQAAADELKGRIAALAVGDAASPLAGLPAGALVFEDALLRHGNAAEPLAELLRRAAPDGLEATSAARLPERQEVTGMGFGAVFVEVGVDADLGEVRVRQVTAAFASGRIVNPLLAKSQHVGGLIGGIGMALHERTVTDRATGQILGPTFADYLIPTHADIPDFDVILVDEEDPHLPGGVKGIGMLGTAGVQAAIANAVYDAVGVRVRHLPIRIEDVLGAA